MASNHLLKVRLTNNQKERLRLDAEAKGYKTISDYVRSHMLEHESVFLKKFEEMYDKVVGNQEQTRNKQKEKSLLLYI